MKSFFKLLISIVGWLVLFTLIVASFLVLLVMIINPQRLVTGFGVTLVASVFVSVVILGVLLLRQLGRRYGVLSTFIVFGGLAAMVGIFYAEEDWRGWHAWQTFKHEAEANGEKFDYASFVPPPVPDDQNFALTPVVASSYAQFLDKHGHLIDPPDTNLVNRMNLKTYRDDPQDTTPTNGSWAKGTLTDLKAWQLYYRTSTTNTASVVTNEFPIAPQPQSPAVDVLLALSKYDSAMEDLRQASRLPLSRYPLNYDDEKPYATLFPQLAALKKCAQVLELRALAELELGRSGQALADLQLSFRLMDSTRNEPELISHLVRIAELQYILQPIYEGLAKHEWTDDELAELGRELAKLDFLTDYQQAMRYERCYAISLVDHERRHKNYDELQALIFLPDDDNCQDGVKWGDLFDCTLYALMPNGWFYLNEECIGQMHQRWTIPAANPSQHLLFPKLALEGNASLDALNQRPWNFFVTLFMPALTAAERQFGHAQSAVDLARVACVFERYRLAHGEYPATLTELSPEFIEPLPNDLIGGEPLKYHRTEDGRFVLYSIGWNETDDGGIIAFRKSGMLDLDHGDWVWQYPAK